MALSITRELSGFGRTLWLRVRVGAAIKSEQCVTEQIDALSTLSVNLTKYLVVPRVIAGTIMLPILVLIRGYYPVFMAAISFQPMFWGSALEVISIKHGKSWKTWILFPVWSMLDFGNLDGLLPRL